MHLHDFFATPADWSNPDLIGKWSRIRDLRRVVTGALELARADKHIGSSLEAAPVLVVADASDKALFDTIDLAEVAITSTATVEVSSISQVSMPFPKSRARPPNSPKPMAENVPAAGAFWRKSCAIPIATFATAAPMRSARWGRHDGPTMGFSPGRWGWSPPPSCWWLTRASSCSCSTARALFTCHRAICPGIAVF